MDQRAEREPTNRNRLHFYIEQRLLFEKMVAECRQEADLFAEGSNERCSLTKLADWYDETRLMVRGRIAELQAEEPT